MAYDSQIYFDPRAAILTINGDPISGAKLNFYLAETSTRIDTYSDAGRTTPNANPVVCDAAGVPGPIYMTPDTAYRIVITDASDVLVKSFDNYKTGGGSGAGGVTGEFASYTELKAATTPVSHQIATVGGARGGLFEWLTGDQSALVSADPGEIVYVAPAGAASGATGVWRRVERGYLTPAIAGADVTGSADSAVVMSRLCALAASLGVEVRFEGAFVRTDSVVTAPDKLVIKGPGRWLSNHTGRAIDLAAGASDLDFDGIEIYSTLAHVTVTSVTAANPAVVALASGHGLVNGDRLKFPTMTVGMAELSGRTVTLTNGSGDTFQLERFVLGSGSVAIDASGYTAWAGTISCVSYAAARGNHYAIFGQTAAFDNGIGATYHERVKIKNCKIHGFGRDAVRIDFARDINITGNKIYDCGGLGILMLCPDGFLIEGNTVHDIGPNVNGANAGYGISVSRVATYNDATLGAATEASIAESPIPANGRIIGNHVYNVQDYVAIDLHSCRNVTVVGNTTDECLVGFNGERASGPTVAASLTNLSVSGNTFIGNSGDHLSIGPGIIIDAGLETVPDDFSRSVTVTGNTIRRHGERGDNPLFLDAGAIYISHSRGVSVVGNTFADCYRCNISVVNYTFDAIISANSSRNLQAVSGEQYFVQGVTSPCSFTVDGNTMDNAGGYLLKAGAGPTRFYNIAENETVSQGLDAVLGSGNTVVGGAETMDASTRAVVRLGAGVCTSGRVMVKVNTASPQIARGVSAISLPSGSPVVVTTTASHGYSTGHRVRFQSVVGTTELNNKLWRITVIDADEFSLDATDGDDFTAYVSDGTIYSAIEPESICQVNREQIINSVTYNSTGIVDMNLTPGAFDDAPLVVVSPTSSSAGVQGQVFSNTTSLVQTYTVNASNVAANYANIHIVLGGA